MSEAGLVLYGLVALVTSIFSGISGGGAGMINTPLAIFLGLSPQEAIVSGKFGGLSAVAGSIRVLRKEKLHSWHYILPLMVLATVIGLLAPNLITNLEEDTYKKIIGVLLIGMVPVVYMKKIGVDKRLVSDNTKALGWLLVMVAMGLQAVFSSGLGTLVNLVLVSFMGMGAIEANVTKRFSQIVLNSIIIIGLWGSGFFVWEVIIVGSVANLIGSTIGSKIAVKKGNNLVMTILMIAMLMSGIAMLLI